MPLVLRWDRWAARPDRRCARHLRLSNIVAHTLGCVAALPGAPSSGILLVLVGKCSFHDLKAVAARRGAACME